MVKVLVSKWGKLALEHLVQGYGGVFHMRTYGTTHVGRWPFSVLIFPALLLSHLPPQKKFFWGQVGWGKSTVVSWINNT